MNKDRREILWNCLIEMKEILDSVKCPFFLIGGTLLGFVRDKYIIEGDKDLDVCVLEEYEPLVDKAIVKAKELGWKIQDWHDESMYGNKGRLVSFYHDKFKTSDVYLNHLDVFVSYRHKTDLWFGVPLNGKCYIESYPFRLVENLKTIEIKGVTFNIPNPVEDFLQRAYGNWKVPVHGWSNLAGGKEIIQASSFDNNLIQELGVHPLFAIMSPRDIKFVKEGLDKIDYIDKIFVKYFNAVDALKKMYEYFLAHKEYTHIIIHSDDAVPNYEYIAMLIADVKKYRFKSLSGIVLMDYFTQDNRVSVTIKPVYGLHYLVRDSYACIPYEFINLKGIIRVWFQGFALTMLSRDVVEQVAKLMWTIPEHTAYDLPYDVILAVICHDYLHISQHVDLRAWYWHYIHVCKPPRLGTDSESQWYLKVGLLPSRVDLVRAKICVPYQEPAPFYSTLPKEYKDIYKKTTDKLYKDVFERFVRFLVKYKIKEIPQCPPVDGGTVYDENFNAILNWQKWNKVYSDFQEFIENPKILNRAMLAAKILDKRPEPPKPLSPSVQKEEEDQKKQIAKVVNKPKPRHDPYNPDEMQQVPHPR